MNRGLLGTNSGSVARMSTDSTNLLKRYNPWRKKAEWGFWIGMCIINAVANSATEVMDLDRHAAVATWEPIVWESSSAIAILMLVWPVVWFSRRVLISWQHPANALLAHLGASVVWSLAHVLLMVTIREIAYMLAGGDYSFGAWHRELLYEYLKDVRTYAGIVLTVEGYRFILRRMQGEARWLDRPDPEIESTPDRPERFVVKMLGREFLVPSARIEYASAAGNYVNLHVAGKDYPLRSTMKGLLAQLDPDRFRRAHRSHIINLDYVVEIRPGDDGDAAIAMHDGAVLPCSRAYRRRLLETDSSTT